MSQKRVPVGGWGSAPDPVGRAYSAPSDTYSWIFWRLFRGKKGKRAREWVGGRVQTYRKREVGEERRRRNEGNGGGAMSPSASKPVFAGALPRTPLRLRELASCNAPPTPLSAGEFPLEAFGVWISSSHQRRLGS